MKLKSMCVLNILTFYAINSYAGSFRENSISFTTIDSIVLTGTLTLPAQQKPLRQLPAVLLLPGSGPTDRDGNQPPGLMTDLLKQLAHDLAAKGLASFRFDKRAVHTNQKQWPTDIKQMPKFFSWQNHQTDIQVAFKTMAKYNGIDPSRLAILGHSEGGILALSQAELLVPKALVLIGTPGRTLGVVITNQISDLLDKQNVQPSVKNDYLEKNAAIQKFISEKGTIPPDVPQGLKALYPAAASLYFKDVLNLDPTTLAKNFIGPVLILNGEQDKQVSPRLDAEALYVTLQNRENSVQKLFIVPSASHNLKKVTSPADAGFAGPVDAQALRVLSEWLAKNL